MERSVNPKKVGELYLDLKVDSVAFNRVRDQLRARGKTLSKAVLPSYNHDTVDAMALSWDKAKRVYGGARTGLSKTINQYGVEFINGVPVRRVGDEINKESEDMYSQEPRVELKTDVCGRYHYAKAFMYRDVETKRKGCYREIIEGYGVARRQHGDPKDAYVGEGLAVSRALEDLGFKIGRRAWGKVKHNDDIKVMRRQQKERRQEKAKADRTRYQRFLDSMPIIGKVG